MSNNQIADEIAGLPSDGSMWFDVVFRRRGIQRPKSCQQAVVAADYDDQSVEKARERRLVVTGLKPAA
jgi:hypothetical protein